VHRLIGKHEQDGRAHITAVDTPTSAAARPTVASSAPMIMGTVRVTTRATLAARSVPATFWSAFKLLERTSFFVSHLSLL
jgi:hypothetical protein